MQQNKQKKVQGGKEYSVNLKSNEIKKLETLNIVICVENSAFWGNQFKTLITELNEITCSPQSNLKTINIIDTSYLNRHYSKEYNNENNEPSEWRKQNQAAISSLVIDYNCINWETYLKDPMYKQYREEIQRDYDTNRDGFKDMCNNFSKLYAHKNGLEAAKAYFLEEAAAFRLKQGVILYPGKLKDPFEWVMKHYKDLKITILPYSVKPKKPTSQVSAGIYQPTIFSLAIAKLTDDIVGQSTKKQLFFMKKFTKLCNELSDSSSDEENAEIINNIIRP